MRFPVELTAEEFATAVHAGVDRHLVHAMWGNPRVSTRFTTPVWTQALEQAVGDAVVSKALGVPFRAAPKATEDATDVGPYYVRFSPMDRAKLAVTAADPDDATVVLVVGSFPVFVIAGTMVAKQAKLPRWLVSVLRNDLYWIPQDELEPWVPPAQGDRDDAAAKRLKRGPGNHLYRQPDLFSVRADVHGDGGATASPSASPGYYICRECRAPVGLIYAITGGRVMGYCSVEGHDRDIEWFVP
jgi:hypothetical protein